MLRKSALCGNAGVRLIMTIKSSWSNVITVSALVIVAVIETLQQALSQAPAVTAKLPNWTVSPNWNYVPLLLLIVAGVFWVIDHFPRRQPAHVTMPIAPEKNVAPSGSTHTAPPNLIGPLPPAKRVFVDLTPQELTAAFETHIAVQASRLVAAYIGKGLKVSGPVNQANNFSDRTWHVYLFLPVGDSPVLQTQIVLEFKDEWSPHMEILTRDKVITAIGRIDQLATRQVNLKECELID